jgi:hypothetical protein
MRRHGFVTALVVLLVVFFGGQPALASWASGERGAGSVLASVTWKNRKSNMCLAVSGGVMVNGRGIVQWPCESGHLEQQWVAIDLGQPGDYQLLRSAKNSNFCLAVPGGTDVRGTGLIIWPCNPNGLEQLWAPVQSGTYWFLRNLGTLQYVSVAKGRVDAGAPVIQWTYGPTTDQNWY